VKTAHRVIGLDLGYNTTKVVYDLASLGVLHQIFPSAIGTADLSAFSASTNGEPRVIHDVMTDRKCFYGKDAVSLSRLESRREDRGWISSDEYRILAQAAMSHTGMSSKQRIWIVTGLPVAYYQDDKDTVADTLSSIPEVYWSQTNVHRTFRLNVDKVVVVPQPFGSLFSCALSDSGQVANASLLSSPVGIIDVGGKTTNILVANRGAEVARQSTSVSLGGWDIVRAVRPRISEVARDLDLRDHDLARAIASGSLLYYGDEVDLSEIVQDVTCDFCQSVAAQATTLWGSGSSLSTILISGGGANLVGDNLKTHFSRHSNVQVVEKPQLANAIGYYRYGRFVQSRG